MAKGCEFLNAVCKGDTVKYLTKRFAMNITIQSHEVQVLPEFLHHILHKRNQLGEELCLIHDNDLVVLDSVA
jgi:hypothetical protein